MAADQHDDDAENAQARVNEPRRCGYSRCRRLLPVATGRPREFCKESDTSRTVDGRPVSCRELARAERLLTAANGEADISGLDTVELREDLVALSEPVQAIGPLVERLLDALRGTDTSLESVRAHLDDRVRAAEHDRDAARAEAADAAGEAEAARHAQHAAEQAARQAEHDRDAARTEAEHASAARQDAERARHRAEGERDQHHARTHELEQRLAAVTEARDIAQRAAAVTGSELSAAVASLADLRERLDRVTERADRLVGEHRREAEQLHRAHAEQLQGLHERHAAVRDAAERQRREDTRVHAAELAELHARIGALEHQYADTAAAHERATARLDRWRDELAAAMAAAGGDGSNGGELAANVARLLNAGTNEPAPGAENPTE